MKFLHSLFILIATLFVANAQSEADTIEPKGSKVHVLTYSNFHRFVSSHSDDLILMEFYAPWCHHCQMLAPQYREAALELSKADIPRKVVLAKYDDSDDFNRNLRAGAPDVYNFTSYPSLFVIDDGEHERYGGGREAEDIVFHMTALSKGLNPYEEELKSKPGLYKDNPEYNTHVFDLLDEWEFNTTVATSNKNTIRIVEFYSDRCPFCKSLSKEVVEAAKQLKAKFNGEVEVHAVNSRVYHFVAEDWGVTGYPWVCFFYKGEKVDDMAGLGGAESIVNWASKAHEKYFDKNNQLPEVKKGIYPTLNAVDGEKAKARRIKRLEAEEKGEVYVEEEEEETAATTTEEVPVVEAVVEVTNDATTTTTTATATTKEADKDKGAAWRAKLGQNTWFLLHTIAAKYPDNPSEEDKAAMIDIIAGIGQLYPCKNCRAHLQEKLSNVSELGAPDVDSREGLSKWMCKLHNSVNADLKKPIHDCTPFALDLIYLKDCGECEHDKKGKKVAGEDGSSGVWDRETFRSDPTYYQTVVKSETDAWEARELLKLWDMALQLDLASEPLIANMKKKILSGERDQNFYIDIWSERIKDLKQK